jgi:hypothetical protein
MYFVTSALRRRCHSSSGCGCFLVCRGPAVCCPLLQWVSVFTEHISVSLIQAPYQYLQYDCYFGHFPMSGVWFKQYFGQGVTNYNTSQTISTVSGHDQFLETLSSYRSSVILHFGSVESRYWKGPKINQPLPPKWKSRSSRWHLYLPCGRCIQTLSQQSVIVTEVFFVLLSFSMNLVGQYYYRFLSYPLQLFANRPIIQPHTNLNYSQRKYTYIKRHQPVQWARFFPGTFADVWKAT